MSGYEVGAMLAGLGVGLALLLAVVLRNRHDCSWREVGREWTPPATGRLDTNNAEYAARYAFGFTTIEQTCKTCGALRFTTCAGRAREKSVEITPEEK